MSASSCTSAPPAPYIKACRARAALSPRGQKPPVQKGKDVLSAPLGCTPGASWGRCRFPHIRQYCSSRVLRAGGTAVDRSLLHLPPQE